MIYVVLNSGDIFEFKDNADYMQYLNIKKDFHKAANNLVDLCDGFEMYRNNIYTYLDMSFFKDESAKPFPVIMWMYNEDNNIKVKGYIRVDGGLKYIAKLNENGEFIKIKAKLI